MYSYKRGHNFTPNMVSPEIKKIDYFLSHPIQYISPLLNELARNVDLNVYYYSDHGINNSSIDPGFGKKITWDIPLLKGYNYIFLKNISRSKKMDCKVLDVINPSIFKILLNSKSKIVVVNGWSYSTDLVIILTAWLFRKKVWLRAENPLHKEINSSKWKRILRILFLKYFLFQFVDRFLYIGTESKKYFRYFGVKESKLIFTPYSVDNVKFQQLYQDNKDKIPLLKAELGIPMDRKVILFCGKFIHVKRPFDILKAFQLLDKEKYALILVGDGPLNPDIHSYIEMEGMKNVFKPGFINQSEIFKYYTIADVFVLCSQMETWGLAVNEAINFNLPCVVSNNCGCSFDLIESGNTGYVFEMGNIEQLKAQIQKAVLIDRSENHFEILNKFSIKTIVDNIKNKIQ
jgi:glycosyltransferase involved in cell wall biosynthesis